MVEISSPYGTWAFDGETLRIIPGGHRRVHKLRKALGELSVPLVAIAGVSFEPGRKTGRLRLRLRDGADPLSLVAQGMLDDNADPYQLTVPSDQASEAEYLADAVRYTPGADHGRGPVEEFLLPGPAVPTTVSVAEASTSFDGQRVRIEWGWQAAETKRRAGTQEIALGDLLGVDWRAQSGLTDGQLRFRVKNTPGTLAADKDPHCVKLLWGTENETLTVLVAAAVAARLPHPAAADHTTTSPATLPAAPRGDKGRNTELEDVDAVLGRLRELGELRKDGILDDDEFALAKQALLRRLSG